MPRPSPLPRTHRQQPRPQVHRPRPQGRQDTAPAPTPRSRPPATAGPPAKGTTPRIPQSPPPTIPTPKAPEHTPRGPFSAPIPRHFCTRHQPQPAQADAASRTKKPVLPVLQSRDKSQAPILRPSQRRFCAFCVIPRHRQQSQFRPFSRPPDTALLYPPRSYPARRCSAR